MTVSIEEVLQVQAEADCLWTSEQIHAAIDSLAADLTRDYAGRNPVLLVVMTGGMMFASELMKRLDFPLSLDYVHASRYGTALSGASMTWKVAPGASLEDRHVVIVDDILDEGNTLAALLRACEAQGTASLASVVLVDKLHDRKCAPGLKAGYTALTVPDRYVFGFGMDYKGYLRNLPGIHAVKGM